MRLPKVDLGRDAHRPVSGAHWRVWPAIVTPGEDAVSQTKQNFKMESSGQTEIEEPFQGIGVERRKTKREWALQDQAHV